MVRYLMLNKEIIKASSFKSLRKKVIKKIEKDDAYLRSFIKGVGE